MMDDEDDMGGKVTGVDELEEKPQDAKEKNGICLFIIIICWFWFCLFIFRFLLYQFSYVFFLGRFPKARLIDIFTFV